MRVPPVAAFATLAGVGLAACATHPADRPDATRLVWLAESLADELQAADADDPRLSAAAEPLRIIAGYADLGRSFAPDGLQPTLAAPIAAIDDLALPAISPAPLAPLASARLISAPAPEQSMGLALGRFTDASMAGALWREVQGLESAALTGLSGFTVHEDQGVVLLAGPVDGAGAAEERCMALTVWGLSCVPAAWPAAAQPIAAGEGGR